MRQIGTLSNENYARRFGNFLSHVGIANRCEVSFDPANGHMSYQIWVHEEDRLAEAASALQEFEKNPSDSKFDAPEVPPPPTVSPENPIDFEEEEEPPAPPEPRRFKNHLTTMLLALCAFVFFLNALQEIPLSKEKIASKALTPIQADLMYDLPPGVEPNVPIDLENLSYWSGIYDWAVLKITGKETETAIGPLFVKIRQGEIWRLISPCILHKDLLHILFNMLWLWYLGRPIEQRIGPSRTLLLTLIAGIGSNTIQYFMSGPFFIGYSGIVTALAGFIWMRERVAPWEGYPLNKPTIFFLLFFIAAILALQIIAFFIQIFTSSNFAPNIANTAHIAGAIIGALLARSQFFAQRVYK